MRLLLPVLPSSSGIGSIPASAPRTVLLALPAFVIAFSAAALGKCPSCSLTPGRALTLALLCSTSLSLRASSGTPFPSRALATHSANVSTHEDLRAASAQSPSGEDLQAQHLCHAVQRLPVLGAHCSGALKRGNRGLHFRYSQEVRSESSTYRQGHTCSRRPARASLAANRRTDSALGPALSSPARACVLSRWRRRQEHITAAASTPRSRGGEVRVRDPVEEHCSLDALPWCARCGAGSRGPGPCSRALPL
jgi:hypothetical protein